MMLVKETQVITSPHAPSKPWLWRFVSSSPGGLWNILNFHLHYSVTTSRVDFFPRLLFHRNPKPNHADRSIAIEKKRTTWRKPILLEYWWILQIVFPAYRFVWSKCSTNNGILNAIGRAKCSQKKTPIQFHSQSRLRTSKARKSSTTHPTKTTEGKKQWNNFPHAHIIYFSHFNSRCKYSKYLDSQPNTLFVSAYIKRLGWIG